MLKASPSTTQHFPSFLVLAHIFALTILSITYHGASTFQDITDALAFYGVYHRNPINQIIHFFGVPCIIWSLLLFLTHLKVPFVNISLHWLPLVHTVPTTSSIMHKKQYHMFNYATILTLGYILFYIHLDTYGGLLYMPFAYLLYSTAVYMYIQDQSLAREQLMKKDDDHDQNNNHADTNTIKNKTDKKISWIGTGAALKIAFIFHFFGWYVQIHPGHAMFEGAKPAVMKSIGGALTSAPLFAYYEGLWFIGFNKGLQQRTKELVDVYTMKLCREGVVMRACADYDLNDLN